MNRRPCPRCHTLNLIESRSCARCGAPITRQTIIIDAGDAPYRVVTDDWPEQPAVGTTIDLRDAVAIGAAAVAAELALSLLERHVLRRPAPISDHVRRVRNGALSTLAGAAALLAEQSFGNRPGRM